LRAVTLPAGRAPTPRSRGESSIRTRIFSSAGLMVSLTIAERQKVTVSPAIAHVLAATLSDSFSVAGKPAASSSTANHRNGLPYQLDRAENQGDHEHHRRGDAYGQNVIQHNHPE